MGNFIPVEPEKWAEMVKALADNSRLKAEVEELTHDANEADQQYEHAISRVRRLEAEVERLTQEYSDATNHYNKLHNDLQAEVERLRKMSIDPAQVKKLVDDGVQDRPYHYTVKYTVEVSRDAYLRLLDAMTAYWNATKDGKQS